MRVILDENLPHALQKMIVGHDVFTVQGQGWSGITNGELIKRVEGNFDVFVTADKNLRYQQNLRERSISIIKLPTNRLPVLQSMSDQIAAAIDQISPRSYHILEI